MEQTSTNTADCIVLEKLSRSQRPLYLTSKHPQKEHVDDKVPGIAVDIHVGKELPYRKITENAAGDQAKSTIDKRLTATCQASEDLEEKASDISDEEIFDRGR